MKAALQKVIIEEATLLTKVDDSFGITLDKGKGLFVQVVDYGEGEEYFIELNEIDADGAWEPCAPYNAAAKFGDTEDLCKAIEEYLNDVYFAEGETL